MRKQKEALIRNKMRMINSPYNHFFSFINPMDNNILGG